MVLRPRGEQAAQFGREVFAGNPDHLEPTSRDLAPAEAEVELAAQIRVVHLLAKDQGDPAVPWRMLLPREGEDCGADAPIHQIIERPGGKTLLFGNPAGDPTADASL